MDDAVAKQKSFSFKQATPPQNNIVDAHQLAHVPSSLRPLFQLMCNLALAVAAAIAALIAAQYQYKTASQVFVRD